MTARHEGAYTTVAASNDIANAVDQAQYADQAGPCLDAIETEKPLGVPNIAATMRWPRFRETAFRLGLRTSLSIPLFAGRGKPVAGLNLYGHNSITMTALTDAVRATYDEAARCGTPRVLAMTHLHDTPDTKPNNSLKRLKFPESEPSIPAGMADPVSTVLCLGPDRCFQLFRLL